jgi:hypothetical protein
MMKISDLRKREGLRLILLLFASVRKSLEEKMKQHLELKAVSYLKKKCL